MNTYEVTRVCGYLNVARSTGIVTILNSTQKLATPIMIGIFQANSSREAIAIAAREKGLRACDLHATKQ